MIGELDVFIPNSGFAEWDEKSPLSLVLFHNKLFYVN